MPAHHRPKLRVLLACGAVALTAGLLNCGDLRTLHVPADEHDTGAVIFESADAGPHDAGPHDAGPHDAGPVDAGYDGGHYECDPSTLFIYTLDTSNTLYRFDPPTLTFTTMGVVDCPEVVGPYSMAVDRLGTAWVEYQDGNLFKVDTNTAHCVATSFAAGQHGFQTFGMGFATEGAGSSRDTLFVSDAAGKGLAKIDTTSFVLTPIHAFTGLQGTGLSGRAELTGTGAGLLFGAFEGMPFELADIDKSDARIFSQQPMTGISSSANGSSFTFGAWGGSFWIFEGPGFGTNVYRFNQSGSAPMLVKSVSQIIVGAGVSTCAPMR
jgi:hypothetical protein